MKKKINNSLLLMLIFIPYLARPQELDSRQKDLIIKNIISYHFRYAQPFDLDISNDGILDDNNYFFSRMWPSENNNLDIDVADANMHYPIGKYHLYLITKRGFRFKSDSVEKTFTVISFSFDQDYLVAINDENNSIKFLSGNFFLSKIASDFKLDINKPESFFEFLIIRYFKMHLSKLVYLDKKKKQLIFEAYSSIANQEIVFSIDENNFDKTLWRYKHKLNYPNQ